ncbi:hypothetical protein ACIG87_26590 [Micromonospora sp. NPDC051925]|uniref:hypothetical protein n=1 Tax=Micromonospora sp. NPDC051925 TaxID=3364288 RepID=UPI0037CBC211
MLTEPDRPISAIAKLVGVPHSTIYMVLPELLPPQPAQQRPRRTARRQAASVRLAPYDHLLTQR